MEEEFTNQGLVIGAGLAGPVGAVVGAAIGAAIGFAVAEFVEWLIEAWKDDIFPTVTLTVEINGLVSQSPSTLEQTSEGFCDFRAHDGHYRLWLHHMVLPLPILS